MDFISSSLKISKSSVITSKMWKRRIFEIILFGLVGLFLLAACSSSSAPAVQTQAPAAVTQAPASGNSGATLDGSKLVDERCSVCHNTDRIKQAHKDQTQWDQTVSRMIEHGAKLTDAEKQALIEYLAKTYGP